MQLCIENDFGSSFENSFNVECGLYPDKFVNTSHPTFENPTERNPMNITDFFSRLDVSSIEDILRAKYGSLAYHYSYPLGAMIKASMIRRIKCMRSFQKLVNRFMTNEIDAKNVGFNDKIPDRRTFRHWENVRISVEDL